MSLKVNMRGSNLNVYCMKGLCMLYERIYRNPNCESLDIFAMERERESFS